MTISIIHDCDPGNDDALAILAALGSPNLGLRAVTTGAGHLDSERTARNAATVLALAAAHDVFVTRGAASPLVRERLIAAVLDMDKGLDRERPDLPAAEIARTTTSAETIADFASRSAGLTIVTTGPLTNLALALKSRPAIAGRLDRIVTLGGAWGLGNKTAAAEWNILCDPEAAAIIFGSGVPITLIPIDAASQVVIDDWLVAAIEAKGGALALLAGELLRSLRSAHRPGLFGPADAPLNDPLAILVAAIPSLVRSVKARVDIELCGRFSYGRTVVDFSGKSGQPANCDVVVEFDVSATRRAFVAALANLSANGARPVRVQRET
jgi:inosine-uridine nucleoside N-ribohydrolase